MLSSFTLTNASDAAAYYAKDNYYTKDEGTEQSEWYGNGATALGLSGKVDLAHFTALLHGKMPDGTELGKINNDGSLSHRPGWDLTFSAPKSVSILALIGDDKRLIESHKESMMVVTDMIEKNCSEVRIKQRGNIIYENTQNMIGAMFHHDLSREQDPNLHTHIVVMNMTQRLDGLWRSMASKLGNYGAKVEHEVHGFIERVRHDNFFYTKAYHAELAYRVRQLGYEIEVDKETGFFEIVGISKDMKEIFSKRHINIKTEMDAAGLSGGKAAQWAALKNRPKKQTVSREELSERWDNEAKSVSLDCKAIITKSYENLEQKKKEATLERSHQESAPATRHEVSKEQAVSIDEVINNASKTLSVFKRVFSMEELLMVANDLSLGKKTFQDLIADMNVAIDQGALIPLINGKGKSDLLFRETLEKENEIETLLKEAAPLSRVLKGFTVNHYLSQNEALSMDEKKALGEVLGKERFVLLEGNEANERLVKPLIDITRASKANVIIVSSTQIAGKVFSKAHQTDLVSFFDKVKSWFVDNELKYQSAMQFVHQPPKEKLDIVLVDNTQLLSAEHSAQLLSWGAQHDTKMVFLGNKTLLESQKVHLSLEQFSNHGMKTVTLKEKVQSIHHSIRRRDLREAIAQVSDQIYEVKDPESRLAAISHHFARLTSLERQKAYVVVNTASQLQQTNSSVHEVLKFYDQLPDGKQFRVLIPKYVDEFKAQHAASYQAGEWVRFNQAYPSLSVKRGDYRRVVESDKQKNCVVLENEKGKQAVWNPQKIGGDTPGKVEVFKEAHKEFSLGEQLTFLRSDRRANITKGERVTITDIDKRFLTVINTEGKSIRLDTAKGAHQHIDYGYAATLANISHVKNANFIVDVPHKSFNTHQRKFFQMLSQAKSLHLYTDDRNALNHALSEKTGDQISSAEILAHGAEIKKSLHAIYDVVQIHLGNDVFLMSEKQYRTVQEPDRREIFSTKPLLLVVDDKKNPIKFLITNEKSERVEITGLDSEIYKKEIKPLIEKDRFAEVISLSREAQSQAWLTAQGHVSHNNVQRVSNKSIEAMDYAYRHLACRDAGFSEKELVKTALTYALGSVNNEELKKILGALESAGILLKGERSDGMLWTTAQAVRQEREIMAFAILGRGKLSPIASDTSLEKHLDTDRLRAEQVDAIRGMTQTKDAVTMLQGDPGTGKTTILETVSNVLREEKHTLTGLAPTHTAVNELRHRNIAAQTIDSFIIEMQQSANIAAKTDKSHEVLMIDEFSMVSNEKMHALSQIFKHYGYKGISFAGDVNQLPSVDAGKPGALIQTQIDPNYLKEIQRQNNNPLLKKAVIEIVRGDIDASFETLKSDIIEINEKAKNFSVGKLEDTGKFDRWQAMADYFLSKPLTERDNTQLITLTHEDRIAVNDLVRKGLQKEGSLESKALTCTILRNVSMTAVECSRAQNYEKGQIVRFNEYQSPELKSGQYFTISELLHKENILILKDSKEREIPWKIPSLEDRRVRFVEVFDVEKRDLHVGDSIRWMRTEKEKGVYSSETAKVISIRDNWVSTRLQDGKTFSFDARLPSHQHWDYRYAATVHSLQAKSIKYTMSLFESYRKNAINAPSTMVALSRATDEAKIVMDSAKDVAERVKRNGAKKLSALEVIGEFPASNANAKRATTPVSPVELASKEVAMTALDPVPQAVKNPRKSNQIATPNAKHSSKSQVKKERTFSAKQKAAPREKKVFFDEHTVKEITNGLNEKASEIAIELLGKPKMRGNNYLKFGSNKGSLVVTTKGSKAGFWNDFSEHGGTNMLTFIQKYAKISKVEALKFGANKLGIGTDKQSVLTSQELEKRAQQRRIEEATKQKQEQESVKLKQNFAKKLAKESLPAEGTLVDIYLRDFRGVGMKTYPKDIRFHPGIYSGINQKTLPAMLVIARDEKARIQGVQATFLDPTTGNKIDKKSVEVQKQSFGVIKGASVLFPGKNNDTVLIAEGIETGLSVYNSLPKNNVRVTLGKEYFKTVVVTKEENKVVFCLDNDGKRISEDECVKTATIRQYTMGKDVKIMIPTAINKLATDYNDVINLVGTEPIKQDYGNAYSIKDFYEISAIEQHKNAAVDDKKMEIKEIIAPQKNKEITL